MLDDFSLLPREEPFDPFSLVLFKALQIFAFLFFMAAIAIAPQAKKGKVDSKAEFLITMSWPDNSIDDVDLFVQDPLGNVVWYRRRENGFLVLERDDRGSANDFAMVNGVKVASASRQEVVSLRGIVPGEYTANAYLFAYQSGQPVPVTVVVEKLNPTVSQVSKDTIQLSQSGTERTAVRFTLDDKGAVTKTSRADRSILQTFYNPHRNGG